jgi:lipopolysaccharide heptosyltransferase II
MRDKKIKRILIVKLISVGDVLFTTPAVRALRQGFPKAHLTYLVGSWSKGVIEDNPNLSEIIVYDAPRHAPDRWRAWLDSFGCLRQLRRKRFDLAVIFHRTSFASLLAFLAGIPNRIGFDYHGQGRLLTRKVVYEAGRHEVDRYLDVVLSLGHSPAGLWTEMRVGSREQDYASELLRAKGLNPDERMVAVLPGGGKNPGTFMPTKRWPADRFASLIDEIIERFQVNVLLVGGPGDEEVVRCVLSRMKNRAVDLVGGTTFKQLAAVLQQCRLFIAGDSGPLHIAAAVGTPTVGIFGPSDPRLVAPRGEKHLAVWKRVSCSPCYWPDTVAAGDDFSECREGSRECMSAIQVEDVLAAIRLQLDSSDDPLRLTKPQRSDILTFDWRCGRNSDSIKFDL